ncbi:RdgB/HAM1 family non-canonical purine NTP pyrophosphatase [Sulfuriferula nivalis]|uniref:dITP/XTP pyrophosphatase n=1 Tax=Sulfuriferula nivalis TaxID=2675298 RepID=A0A809SIN4_9PROT|nr:RdgB/HAM1 family non-canonical purine NTP pyrophosphatase [Sulfuriferula nivalis]BBP02190.1 non-canonical purine NTP pyrophosphatase [Sulfuriferula nivalis]
MLQTIVIASNNKGKLREINRLLVPLGYDVQPQSNFGVPEAEEPYPTFIENCIEKARHASKLTGLPALADDSGICVSALDGEPGVHSARFAGEPKSDLGNNAKLVAALADNPQRSAYYYCVMVYLRHARDPQPIIAEGRWHGEIIDAPRGIDGFGYDPHFFIPSLNKTAAELSPEEKDALSHRGQALQQLVTQLGNPC